MTVLENQTDNPPVRTFIKMVDGKAVRMGIFTDRLYKDQEEFESPIDCPDCGRPMPKLPTYTGPVCRWIDGGCGYIPKGSRHMFEKSESEEGTKDAN